MQRQSCLAGTRLFIYDDIYAPFIDKLTQAVSRITLGDPISESTRLSYLINEKQRSESSAISE
ncbi:aldehyde dehydrogenase family protein [Pseudomonas fluorescens]|uniref:aldehyde dehydrogenase family protein n=1 Tax=Pseudomonas TaxID=286 RepID=UPI00159477B0|nr:aldehyde dehydrogenase family protein [Pseudomonas carnis]NVH63826.1 aldehyde dehydrogenase family protein [Pseudomonas simiae]QQU71074.1 aldehyde dehydrogenase family protein [Pseudomonas fluorescens]